MAGCLNVNVSLVEPKDPTKVTLQLRNADLVATRAVTDDNLFNEDLIVNAQCFFTATDSDEVLHATDLIQINEQQTKTLNLEIPADKISSLFGTTTKCDVYVVANYGEKITDNSIAAIKSKPITLGAAATQTSFVMDGEAEVNLSGTSLSGTVDLYRAAAKIVVKANINTSITEGGITWTPNTDAITMKYTGSIVNSKISANAGDGRVTEGRIYEHSTDVFTQDTDKSTSEKYVGYQTTPFYSFPVATDNNKGEIDMVIPWKPGNGEEVEYTYQIPVNIALERNHVYIIDVNVKVLGNLDGAELNPSYTVVDWTENPITAGLSKPKYLVVEETQVVMNNVNSYSIPYSSSDAVSAVITSITKPNYTQKTATTTTIYSNTTGAVSVTPGNSINGNKNSFTVSVDAINHVVTLSHNLVNDNTSNSFDYVPYDITVRVTNQSGFSEVITIKQYPAVFVVNHLNNNGVLDKINNDRLDDNSYTKASGFGFVMVNTLYEDRYDYDDGGGWGTYGNKWQSVEGFDSSSNNPNMYIVTTTSLDASSAQKYLLGDSRSEITQTAAQVGFTSVTDVNNKKLNKYRATKTDREDYLSPKFRISSAYGQLGSNTLDADQAKNRCASYQEDGYPAGRWRLATYAELSYIAMLCAKGALPESLFGASNYWSATGALKIDTDEGTVSKSTSSSAYLRCVYDDWYWGNEQLINKREFTWGDESTTAQLNQ